MMYAEPYLSYRESPEGLTCGRPTNPIQGEGVLLWGWVANAQQHPLLYCAAASSKTNAYRQQNMQIRRM